MRRYLATLACILIAAPAVAELRTVGPEFLAGNVESASNAFPCTSPDGTTRTIEVVCTNDPFCYGDVFQLRVTSTPVGGVPFVSTLVNSVAAYGGQLSIACGTDGGFALTWRLADTNEKDVQLFDGQHQPRFPLQRIGQYPSYGPLHALADGDYALITDGFAEEGTPPKLLVHILVYIVSAGDGTVDHFVAMTMEPGELIRALSMISEDSGAGIIVGVRDPYSLPRSVFAQLIDFGIRAPVGGPLQLNTFPRTKIEGAGIGSATDGRFLVVWNSSRQGGRVGRYLVSDASLTTTTSSTTTTTTLPIDAGGVVFDPSRVIVPRTSDSEHFGCPRLSSRVAPDWLTFFGYRTSDEAYSALYSSTRVARSNTNGESWRSSETTKLWLRDDIRLARRDNGAWIAVWAQGGGVNDTVVFSRSTDDAATWSSPEELLPETSVAGYLDLDRLWRKSARVATDGQAWVVVWSQTEKVDDPEQCPDRSPCYESYSFATRSRDDGLTWSEPTLVLRGRYANLSLAADRSGALVLAGEDRDGLFVLRAQDGGATWSGPLSLDQSRATGATLAVDDLTGTWLLAWSTDNSLDGSIGVDSDIVAATSNDAGKTWSMPRPVNSFAAFDGASDYEVSVASIEDGSWIAAWTSHDDLGRGAGMDADIVAAISHDDGATWSTAVPVDWRSLTDDTEERCPNVAVVDDGVVGVAWLTTEKIDENGDPMDPLRFASLSGPCGNGFVESFEQCDDGNLIDGDGCDSNCTATACGNGIVTAGEQCDDGNDLNSDSCLATCTLAVCGDGFVQDGFEQCDDANVDDTDACRNDCLRSRCGDGVVQPGVEQCDDGNSNDHDMCTAACRIAVCGDGIVNWNLEQCDDGNDRSDDDCTSGCMLARCGDGNVWSGIEDCDDGSLEDGDGCNSVCRSERACGDVNGDGQVTTSDALTVLRYAVGRADTCPMNACDADHSRRVTASDALRILQAAVGMEATLACGNPVELVFRLLDPVRLGALQFRLDFRGVAFDIAATAGQAECYSGLSSALIATAGVAERELRVGIASTAGFSGPVDVLYCKTTSSEPLHIEGLVVGVEDASDLDSAPASPWPTVSLSLR